MSTNQVGDLFSRGKKGKKGGKKNKRKGGGGGGLAVLNVSGSSLVTDTMLEKLVETSANTLTDLNVSYCPLVTNQGLGYLISKVGNQFKKLYCWGDAQLTDELFDGHSRVNDPSLEIVGAWMKKSGMRSLR